MYLFFNLYMKKLSEIIYRKVFDDFEEYLDYHKIDIPTIEDEKDFFELLDIKYGDEVNYHYVIYEGSKKREPVSPQYIWDKIYDNLREDIVDDAEIYTQRTTNTTLSFKVKRSGDHSDYFRKTLDQILNICNWFIESKKPSENLVVYTIEPIETDNVTNKLYNDFEGILWRVQYQPTYNKEKVDRILRLGINPKKYRRKYTLIDSEDMKEYRRTYFIANNNEQKREEDLIELIDSVADYDRHRSELQILKIDINKLKQIHNRKIDAFIDPRMDMTCYWTSDFIPPSCVTDITEKVKHLYL